MAVTFQLSDEQRELRSLAHDFAQRELRPVAGEADQTGTIPEGLVANAAATGLTAYSIPERYGGAGVDAVTAVMIAEELAWGDAGLATALGSAQLFAGGLLASGASEEQRHKWLSRMASPTGALGAIAFSEPHAGSDVASTRMRATRDGDEWVLSGEKTWITSGGIADAMLVFARTADTGAAGLSCFVVEGDRPGVTSQKLPISGVRASWTSSVFFDDVRVPVDRLVGREGEGFATAMRFFAHSRPVVAASAVGVARAAFEYAVDYANERTAFGKPIMHNQGVSFMLADMGMKVEAARTLVWKAAETADKGDDAGLVGSYAKAFASDVAMEVTTNAVQVLGAAGLTTDHPTERWMRDAKVLQIVEGTNQIQRLICGRYYSQGVTQT